MSNIKRFLEDVSVSMGLDGVINDDVLEKAHVAKKNELVDKIIPQELKND